MRRFVLGDIHGAHKALVQCFSRSGFDREKDLLIALGDLADGWPDVKEVFQELLTVKNLVTVMGNHDQWLINWFRTGNTPDIWLSQGGKRTIQSFDNADKSEYLILLERSQKFYLLDNYLFVHGGILTGIPLDKQDLEIFLWDRSLIKKSLKDNEDDSSQLTSYDMVFVGHTPTINFGPPMPIISRGVCMLDTGAGWPGGKLTLMNIDDKNFWASDYVDILYPGYAVR